jgi:hypothetical protein
MWNPAKRFAGLFSPAKPPSFTTDGLPPRFLVGEILPFLTPVDPTSYPYPESLERSLLLHFQSAVPQLKAAILEHTKACDDLRGDLPPPRPKFAPNCVNRFLFARLHALLPIYEMHCQALARIRLSILSRRVELLRLLLELTEYLCKSPRCFYINIRHAAQPPAEFELRSIGDVIAKAHATQGCFDHLTAQMRIIDAPFEDPGANAKLIKRIITASAAFVDPETGYLPETTEYQTLAMFLADAQSPIGCVLLRPSSQLPSEAPRQQSRADPLEPPSDPVDCRCVAQPDEDFAAVLRDVVSSVASFAGLPPDDRVLRQLCGRFVCDEMLLADADSGDCAALERHLLGMREMTVQQLGAGNVVGRFAGGTAAELFRGHPYVASVPDELSACHFLTNPMDVMFAVWRMELKLAGLLAEENGGAILAVRTAGNMAVMWKLLFVAAQLPNPLRIFALARRWKRLGFAPGDFLRAIRVPVKVLKTLRTEAEEI